MRPLSRYLKIDPSKRSKMPSFHPDVVYSKFNKKALDVLVRSGAMDGLIDDRFAGRKHFWSAVAVDRPKE